jgi:hypothetical protein
MKTLALLAALALGTALTGQGITKAVADGCGNCAIEQPDAPTIPQTPAECGGGGC